MTGEDIRPALARLRRVRAGARKAFPVSVGEAGVVGE